MPRDVHHNREFIGGEIRGLYATTQLSKVLLNPNEHHSESQYREKPKYELLFLDQAWRAFGIIAACEKSGSYFFSLQK
jgi:hypothetical protein